MLSTIKGVYNKGQIILEEHPEINKPVEVLVTFTEDIHKNNEKKPLVFGALKGSVLYMAPDFNEPLEDLEDYM
ncbi:DUF2281 domain-containing protein [Parafilimonas terrae]|uniref:DUF2281 domain-containing protein n=1 Tax=Parafilimonas terrae TaxID=1465490 RepID=A0A1I5YGC4_9BACT|nr:DUF2281 domain-containing protein [Parafilimonas terrae]SFQ43140.1 Protein of unknown function [Parafilimonas terrae]